MSDEEVKKGADEEVEVVEEVVEVPALDVEAVEAKYETKSFLQRIVSMLKGLKEPHDSREYKEAMIEFQRLLSPLLAVVLPTLFITILFVVSVPTKKEKLIVDIQQTETDKEDDVQEDTPIEEQQLDVATEAVELDQVMDTSVALDVQTPVDMSSQEAPQTPNPQAMMEITAPVTMKSVIGQTRSAAGRARSLAKFGGNAQTEACVMRALRWLKTRQNKDGSWPGAAGADGLRPTGLAILAFLSHGEKPGGGEFGETMRLGLEYLMSARRALDPAETHALAEAYGMIRNPNIKDVVQSKLENLIKDLVETKWGPPRDGCTDKLPRLLPITFSTMALRSAVLSRFKLADIDAAFGRLKEGLLKQANTKEGGFSDDHWGPPGRNYRRTGTWHFMVGCVAMQYLGAQSHPSIEKTLKILDDDWEPPTLETTDIACCPVRGNYWATMVFFNQGGKRWQEWNKNMIRTYVPGQHIIDYEQANYKDLRGIPQQLGYWTCEDMHISHDKAGMEIITTCYVAQQLMVYYRYLPTSSKEAFGGMEAPEEKPVAAEKDDVQVLGVDDI